MLLMLIHNIKQWLSGKKVTAFIIFSALAGRVIQLIYFFNMRLDASHQFIATKNFILGHGISMARVSPSDLSVTIYDPLINWPPGYSLLLAPFYWLFNDNYVAAGLTLGIIAAIVLILISRKILTLLGIPLYLVNIHTLVAGFFIYFFYFIACSDAIAISLGLIAVYFCLLLLKQPESWIPKTCWIIGSLLLCGLIKYLFIPVVFVIPFFLAWKGIAEKKPLLKKAGIISFLVLALALGATLVWQKTISGSATYISEPGRGFFPGHLLAADPFIPGAFLKPDTPGLLLRQDGELEKTVYNFFQWIHVLLAVVILFFICRRIFRKGIRGLSLTNSFLYLTVFLSLAITLLLAVLSLRVEKETFMSGHLWTYIEETRYYGLSTVLIQMAAFVLYYQYRELKSLRYGLYFAFLLLLAEMGRGIVFDAGRIIHFNREEYSWKYELRFQQYADSLLKKAQQEHHVENLVVTGPSYYMNHRVSLYSNAALLGTDAGINTLSFLKTTRPVLLLVVLHETDFPSFQPFLAEKGKEVAGRFRGFYFYTLYVSPP